MSWVLDPVRRRQVWLSRYTEAGQPKYCQLSVCGKAFTDRAHQRDGKYYCDFFCAEEASATGLNRVEQAARGR
jgi:hypothetical protein